MLKKKEYTAKNLINSSRFVHFILSIKIPDIERICMRMEEIIRENKNLCTQKNFFFMSNAVTALALYEHFRNQHLSKTQAYLKIAQPMWDYCDNEAYRYYKIGKSKKRLSKFINKIPEKIEEIYDENWDISEEEISKDRLCFKCSECLYASFFNKYGLADIGEMFCFADTLVYRSLGDFSFSIEQCLMTDGRPCLINFTKF